MGYLLRKLMSHQNSQRVLFKQLHQVLQLPVNQRGKRKPTISPSFETSFACVIFVYSTLLNLTNSSNNL